MRRVMRETMSSRATREMGAADAKSGGECGSLGFSTNTPSASGAAARDHLRALEAKGYLRRERGHAARNYRLATAPDAKDLTGIPRARRFLQADDVLDDTNIEGEFSVPSSWLRARKRYFALRADDASLKNEGILQGDMLVVPVARTAHEGATVIVLKGRELVPGAPAPTHDRVVGVVVKVVRTLPD